MGNPCGKDLVIRIILTTATKSELNYSNNQYEE